MLGARWSRRRAATLATVSRELGPAAVIGAASMAGATCTTPQPAASWHGAVTSCWGVAVSVGVSARCIAMAPSPHNSHASGWSDGVTRAAQTRAPTRMRVLRRLLLTRRSLEGRVFGEV
jgi:hypothetical protein